MYSGHRWKAKRREGEKLAEGRGKGGVIPLASKAALAYSVSWTHKTLRQAKINLCCVCMWPLLTKCKALPTVFVSMGIQRVPNPSLTSTSHVTNITTMEMKQAEQLLDAAQVQCGPAAGFWAQPVPTSVRRAFSRVSVGLETCPRDVKPEPEHSWCSQRE